MYVVDILCSATKQNIDTIVFFLLPICTYRILYGISSLCVHGNFMSPASATGIISSQFGIGFLLKDFSFSKFLFFKHVGLFLIGDRLCLTLGNKGYFFSYHQENFLVWPLMAIFYVKKVEHAVLFSTIL